MTRALSLLGVMLVLGLSVVPAAPAHGLLQVEVLTTSDLFVPPWAQGGAYGLSPELQHRLLRRLAALRSGGAPVKVVLIGQRVDLQDVPEYFGRPAAYAGFLEQLLESLHIFDGTLVVVMPDGLAKATGTATPVDLGIRPRMSTKWDIDALARAALRELDRAPSTTGRTTAAGSHRSGDDRWPVVGIVLAVLAAFAIVVVGIVYLNGRGREPGVSQH